MASSLPKVQDALAERAALGLLVGIFEFDEESGTPIFVQITEALAWCIVSGRLPAGTILPSQAMLASYVGCNRETIGRAYRQVLALKLIRMRKGMRAYVRTIDTDRVLPRTAHRNFATQIRQARIAGLKPELIKSLFVSVLQEEAL